MTLIIFQFTSLCIDVLQNGTFSHLLHCGSTSVTYLMKRAASELLDLKSLGCFSLPAWASPSLQVPTFYNYRKPSLFWFCRGEC